MLETLHELLVDEIKDLYSAENQLTKALPRLAKAVQHPELRRAFEAHLKQTEEHVRRLERVAEKLEASPRGKKCGGMEGLIEEGKELIAERPDADVLDAGLIGAAQKCEHYEMAGYGTARTHAQQLGYTEVARVLQQTLDEEGAADQLLTVIAERRVNREAENLEVAGNGRPSRR